MSMHDDVRERIQWDGNKIAFIRQMLVDGASDNEIMERAGISYGQLDYLRSREPTLHRAALGIHTRESLGRLLGVSPKRVDRWVRVGALPVRRMIHRSRELLFILPIDIATMMRRREYWHEWSVDAITDEDWRRVARIIRSSAPTPPTARQPHNHGVSRDTQGSASVMAS